MQYWQDLGRIMEIPASAEFIEPIENLYTVLCVVLSPSLSSATALCIHRKMSASDQTRRSGRK